MQQGERIEIVEIYVPARLAYLSGLYKWLNGELRGPRNRALLHGFSIYEVNGAFRGRRRRVYEERTLVVRLIFEAGGNRRWQRSQEARVMEIGKQVLRITGGREEAIWIVRMPGERYAWTGAVE